MDDEMEATFNHADMDFLDPAKLNMPSDTAGGDFDDLFARRSPIYPAGFSTEDWMHPELSSVKEESPFTIEPSYPMDGYSMGQGPDLESSNKAMDAAFDFESAASSPSPLKVENSNHPDPSTPNGTKMNVWSPSTVQAPPASQSNEDTDTSIPAAGSPFFSFGLPEQQSPFPTKFRNGKGKLPTSHWGVHSPSSLLEESFGGIDMNGQSPMHTSMSPSVNFGSPPSYPFPASYGSSTAQPQTDNTPSVKPILTVHPTSLKSRVETQIPIRLTLSPLPEGVEKLRLPSHTISKLKFIASPSTEPTPDTLQLYTSLVCTSAMQDREKLKRAFARTAGDRSLENDRPLDGGDVQICAGCIQRERKRASRKKQRKPEEDELFQKDEEKRVIVFNTSEIKEWVEPSKNSSTNYNDSSNTSSPSSCTHRAFAVYTRRYPGSRAGVFSSGSNLDKNANGAFATPQSPTDLQGLQQRFNSQYQLTPSSFAAAANGLSSNSQTPRTLSRQASPTDFSGPQSKRRKHSSSARLPSELTMTRMESPPVIELSNAQCSTACGS
ncbi:Immunoglobulin E-set [Penicillium chermesinum]|nr:Immunoglobulin E-set [Penicillium chermesinum]